MAAVDNIFLEAPGPNLFGAIVALVYDPSMGFVVRRASYNHRGLARHQSPSHSSL
jgi:hypothetical protein